MLKDTQNRHRQRIIDAQLQKITLTMKRHGITVADIQQYEKDSANNKVTAATLVKAAKTNKPTKVRSTVKVNPQTKGWSLARGQETKDSESRQTVA